MKWVSSPRTGGCIFVTLIWLILMGIWALGQRDWIIVPIAISFFAVGLAVLIIGSRSLNRTPELEGGEKAGWTPKENLHPELVKLRAWMKRLSERSFLFVAPKSPAFSKLWGTPDLTPDLEWPTAKSKPLDFLLQIDLSELSLDKGSDWLPSAGRLYAFYDSGDGDGPWEGVKIVYSTAQLTGDIDKNGTGRPIGFRIFKSAPSTEWLGVDIRTLPVHGMSIEMQEQAAGVTAASFGGVSHRIGGFPDELQDECMRLTCELQARKSPGLRPGEPYHGQPVPPEIEKASHDWRLLLQIDADKEWSWSDAGMLYVFVRREDAKRGDFSTTVTIGQSL